MTNQSPESKEYYESLSVLDLNWEISKLYKCQAKMGWNLKNEIKLANTIRKQKLAEIKFVKHLNGEDEIYTGPQPEMPKNYEDVFVAPPSNFKIKVI